MVGPVGSPVRYMRAQSYHRLHPISGVGQLHEAARAFYAEKGIDAAGEHEVAHALGAPNLVGVVRDARECVALGIRSKLELCRDFPNVTRAPFTQPDHGVSLHHVVPEQADAIADLYQRVWGESYPYINCFEPDHIRQAALDPRILWIVAHQDEAPVAAATAIPHLHRPQDRIYELGRIVVDPETQGTKAGSAITRALAQTEQASVFAFAETRLAFGTTQHLFHKAGFSALGVLPDGYVLPDAYGDIATEGIVLMGRVREDPEAPRHPVPVVTPAVDRLARAVLEGVGLGAEDVQVESPVPYANCWTWTPYSHFEDPLQGDVASHNQTLVGGTRLGVIGARPSTMNTVRLSSDGEYAEVESNYDKISGQLTILSVACTDPERIGSACLHAIGQLREIHNPKLIIADVQTGSTTMMATLQEQGFLPSAYLPSFVRIGNKRHDVVRMVWRDTPPEFDRWELIDACRPVADIVRARWTEDSPTP